MSLNKITIRISFGKVETIMKYALNQRSWSDEATYQWMVE